MQELKEGPQRVFWILTEPFLLEIPSLSSVERWSLSLMKIEI